MRFELVQQKRDIRGEITLDPSLEGEGSGQPADNADNEQREKAGAHRNRKCARAG